MEAPTSLPEFLEYLQNPDTTEPEMSFPARVGCAERLPRLFSSLPSGDVFLYRHYLVFLTLVEGPAGAGLIWKQIAQRMRAELEQIQLAYKAASDPGSLVLAGVKWLAKQFEDDDTLAKAIANPNSVFIPLDQVRAVDSGYKWSQGNYIGVATNSDVVFVCQNIADQSDTLVDLWHVGKSMFTRKWQTEFTDRLLVQIDANIAKDAA